MRNKQGEKGLRPLLFPFFLPSEAQSTGDEAAIFPSLFPPPLQPSQDDDRPSARVARCPFPFFFFEGRGYLSFSSSLPFFFFLFLFFPFFFFRAPSKSWRWASSPCDSFLRNLAVRWAFVAGAFLFNLSFLLFLSPVLLTSSTSGLSRDFSLPFLFFFFSQLTSSPLRTGWSHLSFPPFSFSFF